MEKFLAFPEKERGLEKTVLGILRNSRLYSETAFLSIAQALEAFGRRHGANTFVGKSEFRSQRRIIEDYIEHHVGNVELRARLKESVVHANERSFAGQLQRTFEMISPEFFQQNFGEMTGLIRSVVRTRNFYTHLGSENQNSVVHG